MLADDLLCYNSFCNIAKSICDTALDRIVEEADNDGHRPQQCGCNTGPENTHESLGTSLGITCRSAQLHELNDEQNDHNQGADTGNTNDNALELREQLVPNSGVVIIDTVNVQFAVIVDRNIDVVGVGLGILQLGQIHGLGLCLAIGIGVLNVVCRITSSVRDGIIYLAINLSLEFVTPIVAGALVNSCSGGTDRKHRREQHYNGEHCHNASKNVCLHCLFCRMCLRLSPVAIKGMRSLLC